MTNTASNTTISGKSVMVVEDNYLQADETRAVLAKAGARVVGPFRRAAEALERLGDEPAVSAIVLDINLGSGPDFAVARRFHARQVPIVFVTGYDKHVVPEELPGAYYVQKPWNNGQLVRAVALACA
jgi:two-component SAPR family response regulator